VRRLLVLAAILGLAAACAAAPASPEPVVLRVVIADDWAGAPVVSDVIEAFEEEHDGVRIQLQDSPFSQIPDVVRSAIELEQPHDVAHWHAFAAAAADLAEPLDDLWEEYGLTAGEYLPGALQGVEWLGDRYGVPLDTNALVLMANADRLEEAGIDPAQLATIDGFRAASREVVDDSASDYAVSVSASSWAAYGWIVAHGGSLVNVDATGEPRFSFEDPATVAALELLVELVDDGMAPPPFAPDLALEAVESFSDGTTAMHTSGSWDLPITRRAVGAELAVDDLLVLPLPQADPAAPRTVLGGSSLFVPKDAPHRELAFEFMLALTEDEVALRLAAEEGRLPARARVLDAPLFDVSEDLAAFKEQLDTAEVMPLIAYPEVSSAFREALEDSLSGRDTVAAALARTQRFADAWVAEERPT
jgi:multiple sugar transport system substrate-binding protein